MAAKPFVFTKQNFFSSEARYVMRHLPRGWYPCTVLPEPYREVSAKIWQQEIALRLYVNARSAPDANGHRRQGYLGWVDLIDIGSGEGKTRYMLAALNAIASRSSAP